MPLEIVLVIVIAYIMDKVVGDPENMPHIVRGMGWLISKLEKINRAIFKGSNSMEFIGGTFLVIEVLAIVFFLTKCITNIAFSIGWGWGIVLEAFLCYQTIAAKGLADEGKNISQKLKTGTIEDARKAVGRIVGRDTAALDEKGVIKAAIESIGENTVDGVISPLFYMVFGAQWAVLYRVVNTMDSMLGYRNEKYLYFGKVAARLDDVVNFIPARLAGILVLLVAKTDVPMSERFAILKRDRLKHLSINSAHTEAAFAAVLGVELGGDSLYGGKPVKKPTIGDDRYKITVEKLDESIKLMTRTSNAYFLIIVISLILTAL